MYERERRCRGAGVGPAPAGGCLQVAAARSLPTVTPTLKKKTHPKAPTRFGARKRFSRVSVAMTTSRRRHLIIDLCMTRGYSQNKALALRSAPWSCAVWVVGWMDGRSWREGGEKSVVLTEFLMYAMVFLLQDPLKPFCQQTRLAGRVHCGGCEPGKMSHGQLKSGWFIGWPATIGCGCQLSSNCR